MCGRPEPPGLSSGVLVATRLRALAASVWVVVVAVDSMAVAEVVVMLNGIPPLLSPRIHRTQ